MFVCHYCGLLFENNKSDTYIRTHIKDCDGTLFFCETVGYMHNGICLVEDLIHLHKTIFAGGMELFVCIACNFANSLEYKSIIHMIECHQVIVTQMCRDRSGYRSTRG